MTDVSSPRRRGQRLDFPVEGRPFAGMTVPGLGSPDLTSVAGVQKPAYFFFAAVFLRFFDSPHFFFQSMMVYGPTPVSLEISGTVLPPFFTAARTAAF